MKLSFKEHYFLSEGKKKTIALVPGSFKPPHAGHLAMVKEYDKIADEVIVLISAPTKKSERKTSTGKVISAEDAAKIFNIYIKAANLKNTKVIISNVPSPIGAAFDMLEKLPGMNVILGSSKKGGDWKRWSPAQAYIDKKGYDVTLIDPEKSAVDPKAVKNVELSAGFIRDNIEDVDKIRPYLPKELSDKEVQEVVSILTSKEN